MNTLYIIIRMYFTFKTLLLSHAKYINKISILYGVVQLSLLRKIIMEIANKARNRNFSGKKKGKSTFSLNRLYLIQNDCVIGHNWLV